MAPLTLTQTSFFPSWEQCLGYAEGRDYPRAAFSRIRAERAAGAGAGQPANTALEGVFRFVWAKNPQRTINLTHCRATTWWRAAGSSGSDTEPIFGTISLLWPPAQSPLGPDAGHQCQPSIPQPPLLPRGLLAVQTLWDHNQPLQERVR